MISRICLLLLLVLNNPRVGCGTSSSEDLPFLADQGIHLTEANLIVGGFRKRSLYFLEVELL